MSFLLLGAHFLRDGTMIGMASALFMVGLLFLRRLWVARLAQVALVVGAFVWVLTLYDLAQMRMTLGLPYLRMAVILGSVAVMALLSALLFEARPLRDAYRLK